VDQNLSPEKEAQESVEQVLPVQKKPGRMALQIFAILVLLGLVGFGVYAWQNNRVAQLENKVTELKKETAEKTNVTADPYTGWKIYTSKTEKSSFRYPPDWKMTSTDASNYSDKGADSIELQSPSERIKITWISALDGLGGACEPANCPYVSVLERKRLSSAPGAEIVRGTYSADAKTYTPFLGVAASSRLSTTASYRGLIYLVFDGVNNKLNNGSSLGATFSTVGITPGGADNYLMSKSQAETFFETPEGKQARLIIESYSY